MTVHVSEAELLRDPGAMLDRVRAGFEVFIDGDASTIAIMRPAAQHRRRTLEESLAIAQAIEEERGSPAVLDEDFAADMQAIIANRKPRLSAWD